MKWHREQGALWRSGRRSTQTGRPPEDARALVQSDHHGGVHSTDGGEAGALVDRHGRYLFKAVDNLHAIVPIDSAIYEADKRRAPRRRPRGQGGMVGLRLSVWLG